MKFDSLMLNVVIIALLSIVIAPWGFSQTVSGYLEAGLINSDEPTSYQSHGTGILRSEKNGIQLQQSFIRAQVDLSTNWTFDGIVNLYEDGEQNFGFTQAFLQYKPLLSSPIKLKSRIGLFYPSVSIENVSEGWLSPYTYTQSAINSWIGEELKTIGAELSVFRNGRASRSPWSWEMTLGLLKSNDTVGTLLAWRGFAFHDRQSLHHDRINFARIPSIVSKNGFDVPAWTEPFSEIDGRWGYYVGFHVSYFRQTEMRYYFYDNNADASAINASRLYAWDTQFHSFAMQHNLNREWRFMAQWMLGSTDMGPAMVSADFDSYYLALRYAHHKHSITFRYDRSSVTETDNVLTDQNDSEGYGFTIAWRYPLNESWEIGAELHRNSNSSANRVQLNQSIDVTQELSRLVLSYQF